MRVSEEMYQQFCRSMPLACVDLMVVDDRWRQEPLHDFVLAGLSRLEASLG